LRRYAPHPKLLNHLGIKKRLVSYHEHNEESRSSELVDALKDGKSVAVVSDAGTPAINTEIWGGTEI